MDSSEWLTFDAVAGTLGLWPHETMLAALRAGELRSIAGRAIFRDGVTAIRKDQWEVIPAFWTVSPHSLREGYGTLNLDWREASAMNTSGPSPESGRFQEKAVWHVTCDGLKFFRPDLARIFSDERLAAEPADNSARQGKVIGTLPDSAKPNDHRHADFAHKAAEWLRDNPGQQKAPALRFAIREIAEHKKSAAERATRRAFDLMYLPDGTPRQN